jgi:hypothetical protein
VVPALLVAPQDRRLLPFSLWRACLQVYCVAVWMGRSKLWFTKLMRHVVKYLRSELGYRVLPWIDDFLCAPTDGRRPATGRDCRRECSRIDAIFGALGLTRRPERGCWEEAQVLKHLGVLIDARQMRVFVTDRKVQRMRRMAQEILICTQRNRLLVTVGKLRHFCGVAVSLTLALPMVRFYTRSLYWDMSLAGFSAGERGQSHARPSSFRSSNFPQSPPLRHQALGRV